MELCRGKGRQVREYSATTGATVMRRIYEDDLRIAAEYNDAGVITKEYVYGTSANSPDYAIISGVRYRFIKDHLAAAAANGGLTTYTGGSTQGYWGN